MPIKFRDLGEAELESYITEVLSQSQLKQLRAGNDLDFSYVSVDGGRFRVNVYRKETGHGCGVSLHSHADAEHGSARRCRPSCASSATTIRE